MPRIRNLLRRDADGPPVTAGDARWSAVSSAVDLVPAPTAKLIQLLLDASAAALRTDLVGARDRATPEQAGWLGLWPGEHYRLLAGLVEVLQPRLVVEIGTFQGLGSLALLERLPEQARLVTVDIVAWDRIADSLLTPADFRPGRFEQVLADLSAPAAFAEHRDLLRAADLVFLDAPKDGRFEPAFLRLAAPLWRGTPRVLVIDDVRLLAMLQLWRDLPFPKLDATSLGHWSGTGLAVTG